MPSCLLHSQSIPPCLSPRSYPPFNLGSKALEVSSRFASSSEQFLSRTAAALQTLTQLNQFQDATAPKASTQGAKWMDLTELGGFSGMWREGYYVQALPG
jgi:hypothetical protein